MIGVAPSSFFPRYVRMRKYIILFLFFSLLSGAAAQMIVLTPEKKARAEKYTRLRLDYAKSKDYDPYDREYKKAEARAEQLFDQKKQQKALDTIEPFLKKNPYCISLLQAKAGMLREMGRIKEADEVRQTWFGVMDSIMASGDGRSPETAVQVISTAEEYALLSVREWKLLRQALITKNGHSYDVLTVKDTTKPDAEPFDVYFNVDIPLGSLEKKFSK